MGGPRASTIRQVQSGKMCQECGNLIESLPWGGPRTCDRCIAHLNKPAPKVHRICMNFMLRGDWHISFLEEDCRTSLRRKLTFAVPEKIVEMAQKGGAAMTSADRCNIEYGIEIGRGSIWLHLTEEQYKKLK